MWWHGFWRAVLRRADRAERLYRLSTICGGETQRDSRWVPPYINNE